MLNFFLIVHKNFPKISRELQKFPGNCREMRFTGISRDFPGGISREPALLEKNAEQEEEQEQDFKDVEARAAIARA